MTSPAEPPSRLDRGPTAVAIPGLPFNFDDPGIPARGRVKMWALTRAARPVLTGPRRPERPPQGSLLPWQEVCFAGAHGDRIVGFAALQSSPQAPSLLFVHGYKSSLAAYWGLAEGLWHAGFNVFLYQSRATGQSGGRFGTMGWWETLDFEAAHSEFRKAMSADTPIRVHASSLGAAPVMFAVVRGMAVHSLSLDSPMADLYDAVNRFVDRMPLPARPAARASVRSAETLLGLSRRAVRPIELAGAMDVPAFFVVGERDRLVPPDQGLAFFERWAGPKDVWRVPNAGHCRAHLVALDEYIERLTRWHSQPL